MKFLDVLIILLALVVASSGGALLYLVFKNDSQQNVIDTTSSSSNPNNNSQVCIDSDQDGYGVDCTSGTDCDDHDPDRNIKCETLSSYIDLLPKDGITFFKQGEQAMFDVYVRDIPQDGEMYDNIKLRISYPTDIFQFSSFDNVNPLYDQYIPLDTVKQIAFDMVNLEGMRSDDKIGTLVFDVIASGTGDLNVNDQTRIAIIYDIKQTSVTITSEDTTEIIE